jgi:hypothetical protein
MTLKFAEQNESQTFRVPVSPQPTKKHATSIRQFFMFAFFCAQETLPLQAQHHTCTVTKQAEGEIKDGPTDR